MRTRQRGPDPEGEFVRSGASRSASVRMPVPPLRPAGRHDAASVLHLQRTAGNAAVSDLLGAERQPSAPTPTVSQVSNQTAIRAVIPRADRDAEEGSGAAPTSPDGVTDVLAGALSPAPDAGPGEAVGLPDIVMPDSLAVADPDTIGGTIAYAPTITKSGAVDPFGATTWNVFNLTGITVTPGTGSFAVSATLNNPITYNVSSPKTSIASESDPALTSANYASAASDLTPNMSVQGGKPPRRRFWARDLTENHEHFHANERQGFGTTGTTQAQAWLATQTAASVSDVQALLAQVPARVIASSRAAAGSTDEKETRAYGDGAPAYKARADAITAKGTGTGYPAP